LCEVLGWPELAERQYDGNQDALAADLAGIFATRPLAEWLGLVEGEDVCVGPVATLAEAASATHAPWSPRLGEHTEQWRRETGAEAR
jgi:alpha-methylacyl-CoA racemase